MPASHLAGSSVPSALSSARNGPQLNALYYESSAGHAAVFRLSSPSGPPLANWNPPEERAPQQPTELPHLPPRHQLHQRGAHNAGSVRHRVQLSGAGGHPWGEAFTAGLGRRAIADRSPPGALRRALPTTARVRCPHAALSDALQEILQRPSTAARSWKARSLEGRLINLH